MIPPARMDKSSVPRPLYYCPKCQLPYRAVIPYIKHLKKHLIAIIRYNGIKEHGPDYDFQSESYDNTGSLQCPVTDCRKLFSKESEMISHMEVHLEELTQAESKRTYADEVPLKGRPTLSREAEAKRVSGGGGDAGAAAAGGSRVLSYIDSLYLPGLEEALQNDRGREYREESANGEKDPSPSLDDESFDSDPHPWKDPNAISKNPYACEECDRIFVKPSSKLRHRQETHMVVETTCSFCFRRMENTLELIDHVASTHDEQDWSLLAAAAGTAIADQMKAGLKRKPDVSAKRKPEVSLKRKHEVLMNRKPVTSKDLSLKCEPCGTDFVEYKELLKHQHYVHGTTDKKCRLCEKVINSYPSLIGHVNACDGTLQL